MNINLEKIEKSDLFKNVKPLTKEELEAAFEEARKVLDKSLDVFTDQFPGPQSNNYVYEKGENGGWTEAFWTAMMWLCYEKTGEDKYLKNAEANLKSFINRVDTKYKTGTHDLGFLYTLSAVAGYKITENKAYFEAAHKAAELLIIRYHEKGEFIQAWGGIDDPERYRYIIDCLMNLPLLYYVSEQTGDSKYKDIAVKHLHTAMNTIVREDASTFHTFWFDPQTGAPLKGTTHQGYADDSCWARGQSWAVYGLPLSYKYLKDPEIMELWEKIANYFLNRLPKDFVPFWDLVFTDGDDQPRDSSSASISACGLLEAVKYIDDEDKKATYVAAATAMLRSLIENYTTTKNQPHSNGLITDGMYNRNSGHNPECTLWGDYYYLEAIMRFLDNDFRIYW